ncbi:MAG: hypothetical protein RJR34_11995 [Candidatus Methanoculleus thermohydrogenotrophicum]|nr:hypothetical protein [Candidatus Methanoculleus thermohydrogenotrophicum]
MCIVLLLSITTVSMAVVIGEGPVELNLDEYVNITPINSTETYQVPQTTVLGALDAASILGKFEYEVIADLSPEEGSLSVLSITGIENEVRNETPYAWTFWVNGEEGTTGPAVTNVTDGDTVTYSYGPPGHSVEDASYTLNIYVSVPGAEVNVTPTPTPPVNVTPALVVSDQPIVNDTVSVDSAVINQTGWLSIQADLNGTPGEVLGYTPLSEGVNENVTVTIETANVTPVLYAVLHVDEGEEAVFEFPGPDVPILLNGSPVQQAFNVTPAPTPPVNVTPALVVSDQPIVNDTVSVDSAVINQTGWLSIQADLNGTPGEVLGYTPLSEGVNENVTVTIETVNVTPVLYAVLHVDEGEEAVFEFPGPDVPILLNGSPVQQAFNVTPTPIPPVNVTPALVVSDQPIVNDTVSVDSAVINQTGWLSIQADLNGTPGRFWGMHTPLSEGGE